MTEENKGGATSRRALGVSDGERPLEYHKAPSMLWFLIPLLAFLAYGYFNR